MKYLPSWLLEGSGEDKMGNEMPPDDEDNVKNNEEGSGDIDEVKHEIMIYIFLLTNYF